MPVFDTILFVLHNPTDRRGDGAPKVMYRISCRLIRPIAELRQDKSCPLDEAVNEVIITMCVEPDEISVKETFDICSRCGAEMHDSECVTCAPTIRHEKGFAGELVVPLKVEEFLGKLGHSFPIDPDFARKHARNEWENGQRAGETFSVHRGGMAAA